MSECARRTGALILAASIAVLLGAYGFEYLGGLAPCQLCYYQRIPYAVAIALGLVAVARPGVGPLVLLALTYAVSSGLGAYHAGVEWKWWPGPQSCTGSDSGAGSVEDLMAQLMTTPVVMCDEIPWSLFGLSLAGYNALISLAIVGFIGIVLQRMRASYSK